MGDKGIVTPVTYDHTTPPTKASEDSAGVDLRASLLGLVANNYLSDLKSMGIELGSTRDDLPSGHSVADLLGSILSGSYDKDDLEYLTSIYVEVPRNRVIGMPVGVGFQFPSTFAGILMSRSGHGNKHAVGLANGVGLIDSDFDGREIVAPLIKYGQGMEDADSDKTLTIFHGQRVAQISFFPIAYLPSFASMNAKREGGLGWSEDN